MEKYIILAGLMIGSALVVPEILSDRLTQGAQNNEPVQQASLKPEAKSETKKTINPLDGRKAYIDMNSSGHFIAEARLNGRKSKVLVDTGATYVAINESTAKNIGIHLKDSDFKYKVRTANGITLAAATVIDEIQIGRVTVRNVRASVSRDKALGVVLLGMAFLKKLRKFEISSNELILTQ